MLFRLESLESPFAVSFVFLCSRIFQEVSVLKPKSSTNDMSWYRFGFFLLLPFLIPFCLSHLLCRSLSFVSPGFRAKCISALKSLASSWELDKTTWQRAFTSLELAFRHLSQSPSRSVEEKSADGIPVAGLLEQLDRSIEAVPPLPSFVDWEKVSFADTHRVLEPLQELFDKCVFCVGFVISDTKKRICLAPAC